MTHHSPSRVASAAVEVHDASVDRIRILLAGPPGAGKSSFVTRFTEKRFKPGSEPRVSGERTISVNGQSVIVVVRRGSAYCGWVGGGCLSRVGWPSFPLAPPHTTPGPWLVVAALRGCPGVCSCCGLWCSLVCFCDGLWCPIRVPCVFSPCPRPHTTPCPMVDGSMDRCHSWSTTAKQALARWT